MTIKCKYCNSTSLVKNGIVLGSQRYKCKVCNRKTRVGDARVKYDDNKKHMAMVMYLNSCGIRSIARVLKTSPALVLHWIKRYAKNFIDITENNKLSKVNHNESQEPDIIEMDEIFTYIKKNETKSEFGLLILGNNTVLLRLK